MKSRSQRDVSSPTYAHDTGSPRKLYTKIAVPNYFYLISCLVLNFSEVAHNFHIYISCPYYLESVRATTYQTVRRMYDELYHLIYI